MEPDSRSNSLLRSLLYVENCLELPQQASVHDPWNGEKEYSTIILC